MKSYFKLKEAYGSYKGYQSSSGASHGHAYGGGGFGKRDREDDEYHVPDTTTHKAAFTVSHPEHNEGKTHRREVTFSNTTKSKSEAEVSARQHLEKQGYKIHEEIDKGEYDYEGQMARTQLQTIMRNSRDMIEMLKDDDNMPEWVQSKITLSHDYLTTARDYLQSKQELGEDKDPCWDNYKMLGTKKKNGRQVPNCVPESVEIKENAYVEAEQHLKQAEAADKEGNVGMHHRHMTKFHERMSEWHSERGRQGSAEKHETLADEHHEKAVKLGEATDARIRLQRAFEREKERRERSERLGREFLNPTKKPTPATPTPSQGVKEAVDNAVDEGIARLISKSIKRVTAVKPTPQEKADIRLNK